MRILSSLYLFATLMLLLAICGVSLAIWSAQRGEYFNHRITLAHKAYEEQLRLSSYTYQLFKQYGDAMLIGDQDEGAGERELVAKIRASLERSRELIGQEIQLVGEEELVELQSLARIEVKIEELIFNLGSVSRRQAEGSFPNDWERLSNILDGDIDRDFRQMIEEALEEELVEVAETRIRARAHSELSLRLALMFGLAASIVTGAGVMRFRSQLARPLEDLMAGVRNFREGRFETRIDLDGRDEVSQVAGVLNEMAARVDAQTKLLKSKNVELERAVAARTVELERLLEEAKTSEANRRQLLADVSHELRTPLTIIQGESDIALRGGDKTPEVYRDALTRAREAAAHTAQIVNDLLFVARKETGEARLTIEETDLRALIEDTLSLGGGTVRLETELKQAAAFVDPIRIRQCVLVLVQNAKQHGGNRIEVFLHQSPGGYRISVEDDGPGMTDVEKNSAFERFFRGSNAAERYSEGSGLGLPIARSIAEAHGGSVTLQDRSGGGLAAVIELPQRPKIRAVS